jgi:uncharacterized oxidoreductase
MRIEATALERLVAGIFSAGGSSAEEASCVARHLVSSNLCGHDSHGVIRVSRYLAFVKAGEIRPGAQMTVVFESDTAAIVDGNMGFGQVIGEQAIDLLAEKAKKAGMALASIRNSGHLGRLGDWAERLAEHGLVSLHFLNTTGLGMMAMPFGGSDRRLSLNPLSICVPVAGRHPILLDMTTTVVAEGKLAVARNKGESVAPGTIVDKSGRPTTDPKDFYDGGALLTIGGHKGFALNVMVDLLSGALSGGGCTKPGVSVLVNTMTSIALDPGPITDPVAYFQEIRRYGDWVTASPPAAPGGRVILPGDFEHETRTERQRNGIPIDQTTWQEIVAAGLSAGMTRETIDRLAAGG